MEGAETIARSISRHATFEQIYLHHDTIVTRAMKGLEEAVVKLYAANLIYLAKAKKYFEEPTLSESCSQNSHFVSKYFHRTYGQSRGNVS